MESAKRSTFKLFLYSVCHPFWTLSLVLDQYVFPSKPEKDKVEDMKKAALLEIEQTRKTIRDHMFTQHMARAKLEALENWTREENLLCDPQPPSSTQGQG